MNTEEHDQRATFARRDADLAELIAAAQRAAEDRGKVWGPEDAATFTRRNRTAVRQWMDGLARR